MWQKSTRRVHQYKTGVDGKNASCLDKTGLQYVTVISTHMNMCVFIETIYVNTVPNCLKYNVYDNIEANGISISEINIFGKYAQIWPFSSLLGEPKILTYQDELLKSFR